jgi:pSer/pThr/pTyr-binding forkhead associated (FHA) protein
MIRRIAELAQALSRDQFIADYPYWFLVGVARLTGGDPKALTGTKPGSTGQLRAFSGAEQLDDAEPVALPLRGQGSVVTVGRSEESDLVLADPEVSKHHAKFELLDGKILLTDTKSRNGTYLNELMLEPDFPEQVFRGDLVRFAQLVFTVHDAGGCWDRLRQPF